jgi:hypothetical protein
LAGLHFPVPEPGSGSLDGQGKLFSTSAQGFFHLLALGDVPGDRQDESLVVDLQDPGGHQSHTDLPVFAEELGLQVFHIAVFGQAFGQTLPVFGILPDVQGKRGLPDHLVTGIPHQMAKPIVDVDERAVGKPVQVDRIRAGVKDQAKPPFAFFQGIFSPFPVGDVPGDGLHHRAFLQGDQGTGHLKADLLPVHADKAGFHWLRHTAGSDGLVTALDEWIAEILVNKIIEIGPQELFGAFRSEKPYGGRIGKKNDAVPVVDDAIGAAVHQFPVAFLALP